MNQIIGHSQNIHMLKKAFFSEKLSHAYLFSGIEGIGKRTVAKAFAKLCLCESIESGKPCNRCMSCIQVEKETHPDFFVIRSTGSTVKIEQIHQLQKNIQRTPYRGKRKIVIIENCDVMTNEAANALLKTLEEPLGWTVFILTSSRLHAVKPTIKSRCQNLWFRRLSYKQVIEGIKRYAKKDIPSEYQHVVACMSYGSLGRALKLLNKDFEKMRIESLELLKHIKENLSITKLIMYSSELDTKKETVSDKIEIFWMWFRDLMIWKLTGNEGLIVNIDVLEDVKTCANEYTIESLNAITKNAVDVLKGSESKGNVRLVLDAFFLNLYEVLSFNEKGLRKNGF